MSDIVGFSGAVARRFLHSQVTPLLALLGLLLGVFAVVVTPREEDPQIDVTFANVFIPFPGATAREVEHLVTTSAEQVLSEIKGIKHIYSQSRPGMAVLTVQYKVGEDRTQAIVRLYNAIFSNRDWLPANLGTLRPLIKPMGIDDVPIVTLTLWRRDGQGGAYELGQVAHALEAELKRIPGTRKIYTIGAPARTVRIILDPARLAAHGIALDDLERALRTANQAGDSGALVRDDHEIRVRAGTFLGSADEVAGLVVGVAEGHPVYLRDVARVQLGPDVPDQYVWLGTGPAAAAKGIHARGRFPAVTIAVGKKPGTNAVTIAEAVIKRFQQLRGIYVPDGIEMTVTRDYGVTADQKAEKLIHKLIFATASVVVLVFFALGWREAFIVGTAVLVTLAITLFASWAWGFTLNRVSLFALIFSIGILVDDAIVIVENIHRHHMMGDRSLAEAIPLAVDEVGGPTILATFTVIVALLPMAFVTGLMGPYMSPIPINASIGMLISLAVAMVVTPWLTYQVLRHHRVPVPAEGEEYPRGRMQGLLAGMLGPFLDQPGSRRARHLLALVVLVLILGALSLVGVRLVILKMLPFDNKSEFQVVVDMPEGTSLERTNRVLGELARYIATVPEVTDYEVYAGTASPVSFNGLVRQYYLRRAPNLGDIQVNLLDKHRRSRKSHAIASAMRAPLTAIARSYHATIKIVEVPPGPPVLSPIVAEIYGPDYAGQMQVARQVRALFEQTPGIVDVDDSIEAEAPRRLLRVDRSRAALYGVSQAEVVRTLHSLLSGEDVTYLHDADAKYAVPLRLELPPADKARLDDVLNLRIRGAGGSLVPLRDLVRVRRDHREHAILHKDLLPVVLVTGDMAGAIDSPLYGMFDLVGKLRHQVLAAGETLRQTFISPPDNPYRYSLKWDGEWQVTYETFRDMGIAYAVGLVLIYLLVVAQFHSYLTPLVIMLPIPLTVIGVMPGHALLHAPFTATSMIGMIALAGIIVRNSILLVDFIREQVAEGVPIEQAVIRSAMVRARPILLTGLAAMLGALFILDDPIFSGLAISLLFGILVSTLLTLVVIPVMYYALFRHRARGA